MQTAAAYVQFTDQVYNVLFLEEENSSVVVPSTFEPGFFSGKIPLCCDLELLRVCSICQEKKMFHKP